MKKIIVFVIVCSVPLWACKKDNIVKSVDITFLVHEWEVISMTPSGTNQPQNPPQSYIFKFNSAKQLSVVLEVNSCGGFYDLPEPGKITINWSGCEKICCDSKYGIEMAYIIIPGLTDYEVKGDTLTLTGSGQIKLKQL